MTRMGFRIFNSIIPWVTKQVEMQTYAISSLVEWGNNFIVLHIYTWVAQILLNKLHLINKDITINIFECKHQS